MSNDLDDFLEEFDELSLEVRYADSDLLSHHLKRWFSAIDNAPKLGSIAENVESELEWTQVESACFAKPSGMVGSGTLNWPDDQKDRLSAQLQLFRKIASGDIEAWSFAHNYFYVSGGNINDVVHLFMSQVFEPFSNELRRFLKRTYNAAHRDGSHFGELVPAADRIVSIDHNSAPYRSTIDVIDALQSELDASNSIDVAVKDRASAEISAGRALLKARTLRLSAIKNVLITVLTWLSLEFASTAVGPLAQQALDLVLSLLPALT